MKKLIKITSLCAATFVALNANAQCENTNLDAWSNFQDNGAVNVTLASAMNATTCGVEVAVDHDQKSFVADTSPAGETRYRARLFVDPNSITMPTSGQNRRLKFHNAQCTTAGCTSTGVIQFKLENTDSGYAIRGFVKDSNSSADKNKFDVPLTDGPNVIEYDLDITAGTFKLWVDATSESDATVVDLSGLDMSGWSDGINETRIGSVNKPVNLSAGAVMYVDEFESRRQTFIGQ